MDAVHVVSSHGRLVLVQLEEPVVVNLETGRVLRFAGRLGGAVAAVVAGVTTPAVASDLAKELSVPRYVARELVRAILNELDSATDLQSRTRVLGDAVVQASAFFRVHHLAPTRADEDCHAGAALVTTHHGPLLIVGPRGAGKSALCRSFAARGANIAWDGLRAFSRQDEGLSWGKVGQAWFVDGRRRNGLGFKLVRLDRAAGLVSLLGAVTSEHCGTEWLRIVRACLSLVGGTPLFEATVPNSLTDLDAAVRDYLGEAADLSADLR
jgi:hypothetical protein